MDVIMVAIWRQGSLVNTAEPARLTDDAALYLTLAWSGQGFRQT
jgi:hypothetical protein